MGCVWGERVWNMMRSNCTGPQPDRLGRYSSAGEWHSRTGSGGNKVQNFNDLLWAYLGPEQRAPWRDPTRNPSGNSKEWQHDQRWLTSSKKTIKKEAWAIRVCWHDNFAIIDKVDRLISWCVHSRWYFAAVGTIVRRIFFGNTNVRWVPDFVLWLLCIPCLCEHFYWIRELIYHLALWLSRSLLVWRMIIIKKNPPKKEYTITRYKKSKTLTIGFLSLSHYRLWSAASRNFCTGSAEAIPEHPLLVGSNRNDVFCPSSIMLLPWKRVEVGGWGGIAECAPFTLHCAQQWPSEKLWLDFIIFATANELLTRCAVHATQQREGSASEAKKKERTFHYVVSPRQNRGSNRARNSQHSGRGFRSVIVTEP